MEVVAVDAGTGRAVGGPRRADASGEPGSTYRGPRPGIAQQPATADAARLLGVLLARSPQSVTAAVSFDRGSDSALTASESSLTCSLDSSV